MDVYFINETLYTGKTKNNLTHSYNHFFPSEIQLGMCGVDKEDVVQVKIDSLELIDYSYNDNDSEIEMDTYFGVLDFNESDVDYIYPSLLGTKVCSSDFFSDYIKNGLGSFVKIKFREVNL